MNGDPSNSSLFAPLGGLGGLGGLDGLGGPGSRSGCVFQYAGARSVVGMPGAERSEVIDISNTINMIPKAGQTRKTLKGPKHLPGRSYNIAQAQKRAQKRLEADTKADAAEVASLKKY